MEEDRRLIETAKKRFNEVEEKARGFAYGFVGIAVVILFIYGVLLLLFHYIKILLGW